MFQINKCFLVENVVFIFSEPFIFPLSCGVVQLQLGSKVDKARAASFPASHRVGGQLRFSCGVEHLVTIYK